MLAMALICVVVVAVVFVAAAAGAAAAAFFLFCFCNGDYSTDHDRDLFNCNRVSSGTSGTAASRTGSTSSDGTCCRSTISDQPHTWSLVVRMAW